MRKYIDAEKIPWTDLNDGRGGVNVYVTFLEKVARMPAADVEEVVRCKECKHADLFYPYCTIWEAAIDGDGYCYKGEKE